MAPQLVAPLVAYLAHESCPVTGELYAAGAGRFARMFVACVPGYLHAGDEPGGAAEGAEQVSGEIQLPAEALMRLFYGRLDPGHTPPAEVTGDPALLDLARAVFPGF